MRCRGHIANNEFLSPPSARRATVHKGHPRRSLSISIPALREEGDQDAAQRISDFFNFYPRPPRGGRHVAEALFPEGLKISIPALREEGDLALLGVVFHAPAFLSPPSARRATRSAHCFPLALIISIPALREEGDLPRLPEKPYMEISIPALREEGDIFPGSMNPRQHDFYPRPPRGGRLHCWFLLYAHKPFLSPPSRGGRPETTLIYGLPDGFLSPPSARRATRMLWVTKMLTGYFYPRPPRGGRRLPSGQKYFYLSISIPALREEGDAGMTEQAATDLLFLSPPSARRATRQGRFYRCGHDHFYPRPPRGGRHGDGSRKIRAPYISIPALREEGDMGAALRLIKIWHFYPRPPRGGRQAVGAHVALHIGFLSPPSARRATQAALGDHRQRAISIPALREEGDLDGCTAKCS